MIYRNAIVLITLAVSSNAFWWGSGDTEPQPTVKQVPLGYFRAYTYHPLAFNPQTPNQYFPYPGAKTLQSNSVYNNWQKAIPAQPGLPSPVYGQIPSHNIPQSTNIQNVPSPITPTNITPVQTTQQSQQQQQSTYSASANPTTSTSTQSQPNDIQQPPTTVPAQFSTNPNIVNNAPNRHVPYLPDPVNLQYITNVAPLPLQQVQFVPCMCPVAISVSTGITPDIIANKRSDDIPIPADYRDTSIVDQPLTEDI